MIAALGALTFACAPASRGADPAWPEGLHSDFFAPLPVQGSSGQGSSGQGSSGQGSSGQGSSGQGSATKGASAEAAQTAGSATQRSAAQRSSAQAGTSWSLAAAEWGKANDGGFPTPEGLTKGELQRLEEGWTVARPFDFEVNDCAYVGGVAFQLVEAPREDVLSALLDVEQLPHALPLTHQARLVAHSGTTDLLVEVVQGNSLVKARYSVRLTRVADHAIRFSMDSNRPHDIRDARGYFTATRFSDHHTLVTVAVGIDLGKGLARSMLKRQVQKAALSAPAHLRRYVEPRSDSSAVALR